VLQTSVRNMERSLEKKLIRKEYRDKRNELTNVQVKEWSETICTHLMATELFQQAEVIYFYYPLGNEVNLLEAAQTALDVGKCIGFPRIEGDLMQFYKIESLEEFQEGCFHVMEPTSDVVLKAEKPLILVPGLVFDSRKNRMGYGKGYYDRYTADVPQAIKVGIAYELQVVDKIPVNSFDIPMDYVITESGIWTIKEQ